MDTDQIILIVLCILMAAVLLAIFILLYLVNKMRKVSTSSTNKILEAMPSREWVSEQVQYVFRFFISITEDVKAGLANDSSHSHT